LAHRSANGRTFDLPGANMEAIQQFRIEEFKALRSEILYQIQEIDQIKFWIVAAMAAYYSFIAAKLQAHIKQLGIFAAYIMQIEELYPAFRVGSIFTSSIDPKIPFGPMMSSTLSPY
jgi:hypothetical protein